MITNNQLIDAKIKKITRAITVSFYPGDDVYYKEDPGLGDWQINKYDLGFINAFRAYFKY